MSYEPEGESGKVGKWESEQKPTLTFSPAHFLTFSLSRLIADMEKKGGFR